MLTTRVSIKDLESIAEQHVKRAQQEEGKDDSDEDQVIHKMWIRGSIRASRSVPG
jgi:hypothetical protein